MTKRKQTVMRQKKKTTYRKNQWILVFTILCSLLLIAPQSAKAQFNPFDPGGPLGPTGPFEPNPGGPGLPPPNPFIGTELCCSCPATVAEVSAEEFNGPSDQATVPRIGNHIASELAAQRIWIISIFWEDNILPALMLMSEQLTATAMKQVQIIGGFFDARQQMETQQVFQKIKAQAHKDYQPSVGMCEFGSVTRSLAASERRGEYNAYVLSQRAQDRHLGQAFTAARDGALGDIINRLDQFKTTYCDPNDNNGGLGDLCTGSDRKRRNKDIDYVRTLAAPATIEADFSNAALTPDEEDLFALQSNLYGHKVFFKFGEDATEELGDATPPDLNKTQENYMDMRALLAKRSVAENSFNALAALKSEGTEGSKDYLFAILEELGISTTPTGNSQESDAEKLLGEKPSYYAQMEVLTKKIYQNPDFYTNLYDKPANVERKQVAMQAIGLMQKFDLFKSYLRQEASMSVLLEMAILDQNALVNNEANVSGAEGEDAR